MEKPLQLKPITPFPLFLHLPPIRENEDALPMIEATILGSQNIDKIQPLYERFSACAKEKYRWDIEPIDFPTLKLAVGHGMMSGLMVTDTSEPEPIAFMLYRLEDHKAIEINVIYTEKPEDNKTMMDRLMRLFVETIQKTPGWDVISYAMLGEQESLIRTITWYGFKPMGQAILKFDIMDQLTIQILMQQKLPDLPAGYRMDRWRPEYAGGIAETIFESFSTAADALWDPRFRTLLGAKGIVNLLNQGEMGKHLTECTSVLLNESGVPVGVCFLLEAKMGVGNVPLVGVRPSEKGKGLGNHLLKNTLDECVKSILDGKFGLLEISATMETDNFAAIKMYRRMGFREEYNYPHVYLPKESLKTLQVGQWCQDGGGMS